jgi:hypothetical protein
MVTSNYKIFLIFLYSIISLRGDHVGSKLTYYISNLTFIDLDNDQITIRVISKGENPSGDYILMPDFV